MKSKYISGYQKGKLKIYDMIAFVEHTECMVIRPEVGTVLGMEQELLEKIEKHTLTDELTFLMVQRGLASFDKSRDVSMCSEMVRPEFFLIDLTKKCNLACKYCFREFADDYPEMTPEMINKICDSLIEYWKNNPSLKLSIQAWGGEPLICLSLIIQIRKRFEEANLFPQIVMETNATLITEDVAKMLFENHIELGISIDGNEKVHNLQRPFIGGQGSLEKVERGITNLRSAGYQGFGTITVVTKYTIKYLPEIIEYFVGLSLNSIKLNMMRKNSRNLDLAPDLDEFDGYIDELLSCLFELYKKRIPLVEQNIAQRMLNLMHRPNNNICNAYGCHGGYRMLSIDSIGKVYPCELSDYNDYCTGNVDDSDYICMVNNAVKNNHEYFKEKNLKECAGCPWWYFCRGGCKAAVKYNTGTPQGLDKTECAFNKALYPKLVSVLLRDPEFAQYLTNGEI